MKGTILYLAIVAPYLAIPLVLAPFGIAPDDGLAIALVVAIVSAVVATFYVRARYMASTEPRSIFWGFLVSALEVKAAFAAWIAYVVSANLLLDAGIVLPVPEQPIRALITGVVAIVTLTSAVYYAVAIALLTRSA